MAQKTKRKGYNGWIIILGVLLIVAFVIARATGRPRSTATATADAAAQVEVIAATAEARGAMLRPALEDVDHVTSVEYVAVLVLENGAAAEVRLSGEQSVIDDVLALFESRVRDLTQVTLEVTSDDARIHYLWEASVGFWQPLDMSNGELLPTMAAGE